MVSLEALLFFPRSSEYFVLVSSECLRKAKPPQRCGQSPGQMWPGKKGAYLDLVSPSEYLDLVSPSECLDLVSSECFDLLSLLKVDAPWLVDAALRILENCVAPLVVLCHRGNKNSAHSRPPAPHARMHTGAQRGSAAAMCGAEAFRELYGST